MKSVSTVLLYALLLMGTHCVAQTVDELNVSVSKGNSQAMVLLGKCYECGQGVEVDSAKAFALFQRAARDGAVSDPDGFAHMSRYYVSSSVVPVDSSMAFRLAKMSVERGSLVGYAFYGLCYELGIGIEEDSAHAVQLYEKGAANNDPMSLFLLGRMTLSGGNNRVGSHQIETGLQYLSQAADLGSADAMAVLAGYYENKGDVANDEKCFKTAWRWLEKGVALNNLPCLLQSAAMVCQGKGVEADAAKAWRMLTDADRAFPANPDVAYAWACFYASVTDSAYRDRDKAVSLLESLADANHPLSMVFLGESLMNGTFTEVDMERSLFLLKSAAEDHKCREAEYWLGEWYSKMSKRCNEPDSCIRLISSMVDYWQRSCNRHDIRSARALADLFANGFRMVDTDSSYILHKDWRKAIDYYRLVSAWGGSDGHLNAGRLLYENSMWDDAEKELRMAADRGEGESFFLLAQICKGRHDMRGYKSNLESGASLHDPSSLYELGRLYERGAVFAKENDAKAASYYAKAATGASLYKMALLYFDGRAAAPSVKTMATALSAIRQSASMGNPDAMEYLGELYLYGNGYVAADYDSALLFHLQLADSGRAEAFYKLGITYERGLGVAADIEQAFNYYQQAAEMGHDLALCSVGDFYRNGRNIRPNGAKAMACYEKAAAGSRHPEMGTYMIGVCFVEGCGVKVNKTKAVRYFRQAVDRGLPVACRAMALLYYDGFAKQPKGYNDSSLYYFELGSQMGDVECNVMMGDYYADSCQFELALPFFEKAMGLGSEYARYQCASIKLFHLGTTQKVRESAYSQLVGVVETCDDRGVCSRAFCDLAKATVQARGCMVDTLLAISYYNQAAAFDNPEAMFLLAEYYRCDAADLTTALRWYESAAELDYVPALLYLASACLNGSGVQKNVSKGVRYLEKAYALGSMTAAAQLAYCCEHGHGIRQNAKRAFSLYQESANSGVAEGMYGVGHCYADGVHVARDMKMALHWYLMAAECGDSQSQFALARIYNGDVVVEGLTPNKKMAKKWMKKAAANGVDAAVKALESM